jgi:heme a synthase
LNQTATSRFHKLSLLTLVAVFVLILVGGIVRSTGSGMGCPDWPKCFGQWVPPSSVDELPGDYRVQYASYRDKKNQKFIRFIRNIGLDETANQLQFDPAILVEEEFNVVKTRVEYVNRVVGVVIGLLITLLFIRSFRFFREQPLIFWAALVAWLAVVITGWFGSIVVSTNLTPWTVSVHLAFAFLIVGMLVYTSAKTTNWGINNSPSWLLWLCMSLLAIQVYFGIQVREGIDLLAHGGTERSTWVSLLGSSFILHRSFSWLLIAANGYLAFLLYKNYSAPALWLALAGLTLASVLTGVVLAYAGIPKMVQPIHLLLSALNFGLLYWLMVKRERIVNTI